MMSKSSCDKPHESITNKTDLTFSDIAILTSNVYESHELFLIQDLSDRLIGKDIPTCSVSHWRPNSVVVDFAYNALSCEWPVVFSIGYPTPRVGMYISKSRCILELHSLILVINEKEDNEIQSRRYLQ